MKRTPNGARKLADGNESTTRRAGPGRQEFGRTALFRRTTIAELTSKPRLQIMMAVQNVVIKRVAPDSVEVGEAGVAGTMLCGVGTVQPVVQRRAWHVTTCLPSCDKRRSESRQVLVGFRTTEAFGRLQHAGGRPAQCHALGQKMA
jgi:hypothetical protein